MDHGDRVVFTSTHPDDETLQDKVGMRATVRGLRNDGSAVLVVFDDEFASKGWVHPDELEPVTNADEWMPVVPVTDIELAFPAGTWQPEWDAIPQRYKNGPAPNHRQPAVRVGSDLFFGRQEAENFRGLPRCPLHFESGEEATVEDGWRMIEVVLRSFRFRQEHKEALLGWAIDSVFRVFWFGDDVPEPLVVSQASDTQGT